MDLFNLNDDMSETEKNFFVRRWRWWHRRGMWFFLACMLVLTPLALCLFNAIDPIFRADDPFAAEAWAAYRALFDPAFFMMAFSASLILGILFWSIGEELYRHFNNRYTGMDEYEKKHFIESWEPRRQGGMLWFVLRSSLIFFLLVTIATVLVDLFDYRLTEALSKNLTLQKIVVKVLFGMLLGLINWYLMERQYQKAKGA